jgi:hypothetical protein
MAKNPSSKGPSQVAVASLPAIGLPGRHTIAAEKIDNGWLVRESHSNDATGEYSETTKFMTQPPRLDPGKVVGAPRGAALSNSLSASIKLLNGKG